MDHAAPSPDARPAASRRGAVLRALVRITPVIVVVLLGVGGKVASIDALREIETLGQIERLVTRLEVSVLRLSVETRRDVAPGTHGPTTAALARHLAELAETGVAERFGGDARTAAALARLNEAAAPARRAALDRALSGTAPGRDAARAEVDVLALLAGGAADAVHAATATEAEALWDRVWALGGAAVIGLLLTALGGTTAAALAWGRVQAFVHRIEEYAHRLKQADADKAKAVAAAELAAVARTEALMAETLARLDEARRLAESAQDEALGDLDATRRSAEATRSMLQSLGQAVEAPLGRIRSLSQTMRVGHVVTATDRDALDRIAADGEALHQLAEGALDLTRLEAGQEALEHRPFRPEVLLEAVRTALAPLAGRRGTSLRVAVGAHCVEAYAGDGRRVQTLLAALVRHLLGTHRGGAVTLAQRDEPGRLVLTIACVGPGTAPDLGTGGTSHAPGLALVQGLLTRMQGQIAVGPAGDGAGSGHIVRVTLPLTPVGVHGEPNDAAERNRA